jgi:hypothetical protein
LVLPFLQPIPVWGLSTISGLVIAFLHLQVVWKGEGAAFPARVRGFPVTAKHLGQVFLGADKILKGLEKFPEFRGVLFAPLGTPRLLSAMMVLLGILLSLPLPVPASNSIPAIAILLFTLGVLAENTFFLAMGHLVFVFNIVFFGALAFFPVLLLEWLRGLFY